MTNDFESNLHILTLLTEALTAPRSLDEALNHITTMTCALLDTEQADGFGCVLSGALSEIMEECQVVIGFAVNVEIAFLWYDVITFGRLLLVYLNIRSAALLSLTDF